MMDKHRLVGESLPPLPAPTREERIAAGERWIASRDPDDPALPAYRAAQAACVDGDPDHIMPPIQEPGPLEARDMDEVLHCAQLASFDEFIPPRRSCEADCARHWTGVRNRNSRFRTALMAIVERSHNDPLGSSKVIDMRKLAEAALSDDSPLETEEGE